MTPTLFYLKGLPASGKSTYARQFCKDNKNCVRVNRDDLRNMRGEYWIPKQESLITDWENSCIMFALAKGYNVILDSTNLDNNRNKQRTNMIRGIMENLGYANADFKVDEKMMDTPLEECLRRDALRKEGKVGSQVIMKFYNKYFVQNVTQQSN